MNTILVAELFNAAEYLKVMPKLRPVREMLFKNDRSQRTYTVNASIRWRFRMIFFRYLAPRNEGACGKWNKIPCIINLEIR
jgi:hypothetical protein